KAAGAHTALISGGFTIFARSVAERCGFESYRANRLEIAKGRLSGKLKDPVLGPAAKKEALRELAHAHAFRLDQTLAVGDGANDIEMICAAGLGVGYRPKEVLKQKAPVSIFHGDLTALLFLQGYRRNEFASS
ncbi:MAG: HAD family phosphatase, partial [Kiloniellales bacterium]|nr:HAD family phosphatase [Kiloniellales bacterium]